MFQRRPPPAHTARPRRWGGIAARGYIMADAHASHHFRRIRKNTHNPMGKYLGFDCSTESLTAVVIDTDSGSILNQCQLIYEEAVPQYQDSKGLLKSNGALVRHSSPLMWAAGLEILLWRLKAQGVDFSAIEGISGSAQQHGTVYFNRQLLECGINPPVGSDLAETIQPLLSRSSSPIWMDLSTFEDCRALNDAVGGRQAMQQRTGSPATERFAGPQIRKFARENPQSYADTASIHLVSSFLCSLFIGKSAPLDYADASGMNLEDIRKCAWDRELLDLTAPNLEPRLPALVPSATIAGNVSEYFQNKFGFRPGTAVVTFSGDNMSRVIGLGGYKPGTVVIALKTSDTCFASVKKPLLDESGYGHVFLSASEGYIALNCFQNGGVARRIIRNRYGLEWKDFDDRAIQVTPPGNNGNMILPYFSPESTPLVLNAGPVLEGSQLFTTWMDGVAMVRALVEAQAMSMYLHSSWAIGHPKTIRLTGSASRRRGLAQVYADVFNAKVERIAVNDAGALGAAIRAASVAGKIPLSALSRQFCAFDDAMSLMPIPENVAIYRQMLPRYEQLEKSV